MNKTKKRPKDAATSSGRKKRKHDSIIIPSRTRLSYGEIIDTDIHLRLELIGGAQYPTKKLLSASEIYDVLKDFRYITIELLHNESIY